jgi:hypothetical protein
MSASWNAIVLIDEVSPILGYLECGTQQLQADVFLEARSQFDSIRNSRVSVFLRLLEYHTGGTSHVCRAFTHSNMSCLQS